MKIGQYDITPYTGPEGGLWIEAPSGEGMRVDEADLVKVLDAFWEEKF